jgi:hypothetical protein
MPGWRLCCRCQVLYRGYQTTTRQPSISQQPS